MKRRIIVPPTITVSQATGNGEITEEITFTDFVIKTLLQDRRFAVNREAIHQADDVEDFFKDAKVGDVVDMPETLWKQLSGVADKPQFGAEGKIGFLPIIRQLRPYLDVICDAKEPPAPPKSE